MVQRRLDDLDVPPAFAVLRERGDLVGIDADRIRRRAKRMAERADFDRLTGEILGEAGLDAASGGELGLERIPQASGGGRQGKHSEHLGYLLAEMQVLAREHPGASW